MAITLTRVPDGDDNWGRHRVVTRDFTALSADAYPAGGVVINASDLGLKFITGVDIAGGSVSMGTNFPVFDIGTVPGGLPTSFKLRYFTASGVEIAGTFGTNVFTRICAYGG